MEDRFKFRAWDNKEHYYIPDEETNFCHGMMEYWFDKEECPLTFEQCTGCRDYERKLIYTNDILKLNGVPNLYQCIFSTNRVGFDFKPLNTKYKWLDFFDHASDFIDHCKIVGNIHENPELLEEDK